MRKRQKLAEGIQPSRLMTKKMEEKGIDIITIAGPRSWTIENWTIDLEEISGQQVDWNFVGGRAFVVALGDIDKVVVAVKQTFPALQAAYAAEQKASNPDGRVYSVQNSWGIS